MAKELLKIEKSSIIWLYLLAIIPLVVAALGQFDIINLSAYVAPIITLVGAMFVASEIGLMTMIRNKQLSKDPISIFGAIVVTLAVITSVSELAGLSIAILQNFSGWTNILVVLYLVIEAFR